MNLTRRHSLVALAGGIAAAAGRNLAVEWRSIAKSTDGTVGAAALALDGSPMVSLHGEERFPLLSVCKLPIAMHLLALVDEGKYQIDEPIEVLPGDVVRSVSPIAERWPAETRFPLGEMVELMVAKSDNTAVETFFRIGGGQPAMAARFRQWRVEGVRVDRGERQAGLDRRGRERESLGDPRDTGTPNGTVQLLARLFRGEALSAASTARLIAILKSTTTFPTRIKGMLPPGTVVAHKTGSSAVVHGFALATNDSGVVFLPNGRQLAMSVYLKGSTRPDGERDRVIARIARAAYDAFA
jgi:beta-lactamase class A